ncbi:cullin-2-like [Chrysoperla carnea]|uniref:cullin-2-like n=1 Tax=Chrysoperla carnea TaxID=189513 RepID=UPI001D06C4EC|nr:cullin-2-like [Chrysoperla carnea]
MQVCAKHFKNLSKNVIKTGDIISYLNEVTRKLGEESLRSQKYLDPSSDNKITQIILSEMIENHLPYINKEYFHRILDRACAHIINYKNDPKTICKSAGFLAKYCDNLIKKSAISTEHDEIEFTIKLDRIIIIFRYLDDKDYFHKFYSRLLAKRLIYKQSDMNIEELMINKLKNTIDHLTVNDILSNTAMTFDDIFKRHLNGLLDLKLLLLENNHTEISTDTKLILNLNFSHKRTKLRISPITQKLTVNPQTRIGEGSDLEVCASVEKDRQVYLQAAIVRIMKMHKQLKHNALIEEIFKIKCKAQFSPTINLIKSSIETLIEKAYLSRDEKDPECYNYSA